MNQLIADLHKTAIYCVIVGSRSRKTCSRFEPFDVIHAALATDLLIRIAPTSKRDRRDNNDDTRLQRTYVYHVIENSTRCTFIELHGSDVLLRGF